MTEKKKILLLVGIIPPHTCKDEFTIKMQEYYLLKAKDAIPDLEWEIKAFEEDTNTVIQNKENKGDKSE